MALRKPVELSSGHSAEYHKILELHISYDSDQLARAVVGLFKDAASKAADKEPIQTMGYELDPLPVDEDPRAACYNQLKQLPEFSGSEDV